MKYMNGILAAECMGVILDSTGIKLSRAQFDGLMRANPMLNDQLIDFNSPSDTMDREELMSAVGRKLAGRDWPTYGEGSVVYEKFKEDLNRGALRQGYETSVVGN